MASPKFTIITKQSVFNCIDHDSLFNEQEAKCKELGIDTNPWAKETGIHKFNSVFCDECYVEMTVHDAIDALAIKEGADLVQFENGNYGFVAYYGDHKDGFEIEKETDVLKRKVAEMLEDAIQNIYIVMQDKLDITAGDVPVEYAIDEHRETEKLVNIIVRTLEFQKEAR